MRFGSYCVRGFFTCFFFSRVLTGVYQVLPGFTWLEWVSIGFNKLHWVIVGYDLG